MQENFSTDYANINPYLLYYCNMGLKVVEGISPETAQNVARQLGYLYNAFGHVTKDLIKVLSLTLGQNQPHQQAHQHIHNSASRTHYNVSEQPMEIEHPHQYNSNHKNQYENRPRQPQQHYGVRDQDRERERRGYYEQGNLPPNANLFDQYAYADPPFDIKKNQRQKEDQSFKESLARIVGEVSNKKKKQAKKQTKKEPKRKAKEEKNMFYDNPRDASPRPPRPQEPEKGIQQIQNDMFREFQYSLPAGLADKTKTTAHKPVAENELMPYKTEEQPLFASKQKPQETPSQKPSGQERESPAMDRPQPSNRIYDYLKPQTSQPQVYEISDDD